MIRTSKLEFQVNNKTGFIDSLRYKGVDGWREVVLSDHERKGIFMKILRDPTYSGRSSITNGHIIDLEPFADNITIEDNKVLSTGNLKTKEGESKARYYMAITVVDGEPYLKIDLQLESLEAKSHEYVVEAGICLPVNLDNEKIVCTPGDCGIVFNSRYTYEYVASTENSALIPVPDISTWRVFMVDQETPNSFRMWKAEDKSTNIVPMMYGKFAPGWIGAEDGRIGVMAGYKDFSQRSPAGLLVNAEAGGELHVLIHPYTARPVKWDGPGSEGIFGPKHEMVFYFYDGDWKEQDENGATVERRLGQLWGVDRFPSEEEHMIERGEPRLQLELASGSASQIVKNSVPFPQGQVTASDQVRFMKDGLEVPLQTDVLGYWPDGSIKWLLLSFPIDDSHEYTLTSEGISRDKSIPINVTTRLGTVKEFKLYYGAGTMKAQVKPGIKIDKTEGKVTVDTRAISFSIEKDGTGFLDQVFMDGKEIVSKGGEDRSFLDYIHTSEYDAGSAIITGERDPSSLTVDSITLEEEGPIRALIALRGTYHNNGFDTPYTIWLEVYANRSYIRVFHTFLYMGEDAYTDFITSIGLRLPLSVKGRASIAFGGEDGPFELTKEIGGLHHTSGLGYEIWEAGERGAEVSEYGRASGGWADISWDGRGVAVIMRNMREESPKELIADVKHGMITAYLWPESSYPINMRRYSETPHRGQGESLAHIMDRSNYKILPYGIGKTHELMVYFHEGDREKAQVNAVAEDFHEPTLVYVSPEWYAHTEVYGDLSVPDQSRFTGADRVEENLQRIWDFHLFHQKFWNWYGMWDYGDFQHRFGTGYGWSEKYGQYVPEHGWAYDNGRWAWKNNESVPNYGLGLMYLRTGKREYYFAAEAMARHIMDVDVHHAGRWKGLGARHNVQHWGDGNREERHANVISYIVPYFLSGDPRTKEVVNELVHEKYLVGIPPYAARHGAAFNGIFMVWEMTGDKRYEEILANYVNAFIDEEGIYISPSVSFPEGVGTGEKLGLNSGNMFFHNFGCLAGLVRYHELTQDKKLRHALIRMADAMDSDLLSHLGINLFAARWSSGTSKDKAEKRMIESLKKEFQTVIAAVPVEPNHWVGEKAYTSVICDALCWYINDMIFALNIFDEDFAARIGLI